MEVIKVRSKNEKTNIIYSVEQIDDALIEAKTLLENGDVGERVTLTLQTMTEKQFENLKEFEGY